MSPAVIFESTGLDDYVGLIKIHLTKFRSEGTMKGYMAIICANLKRQKGDLVTHKIGWQNSISIILIDTPHDYIQSN